jgi:hypothetical protein
MDVKPSSAQLEHITELQSIAELPPQPRIE